MKRLRDFPRPDLGPNIGPFPIQKWTKSSQNGVYHLQFLSSTFWFIFSENYNKKQQSYRCMKICIKCDVFIHIFMQIYMNFYERQLKEQIWYSFTLLISDIQVFNQYKMAVQIVKLHQVFRTLMVQMLFYQFQLAPGPNFRKVGKSLRLHDTPLATQWSWPIFHTPVTLTLTCQLFT